MANTDYSYEYPRLRYNAISLVLEILNGQQWQPIFVNPMIIAPVPAGNIIVGNASNVGTNVVITGDMTFSNAGVSTVSNVHYPVTPVVSSGTISTPGFYWVVPVISASIVLALASTFGSGAVVYINSVQNASTTVTATSPNVINGSGTPLAVTSKNVTLISDGSNWHTLGN